MSVHVSNEAAALVMDLALPIADYSRRQAFLAAVADAVAASPSQGPGQAHQIARRLQRSFYDPPADARIGTNQRRA